MKRRSFIKTVFAGLAGLFVASKAEAEPQPSSFTFPRDIKYKNLRMDEPRMNYFVIGDGDGSYYEGRRFIEDDEAHFFNIEDFKSSPTRKLETFKF